MRLLIEPSPHRLALYDPIEKTSKPLSITATGAANVCDAAIASDLSRVALVFSPGERCDEAKTAELVLWDLRSDRAVRRQRLTERVRAVTIADDGSAMAAATPHTLHLLTDARETHGAIAPALEYGRVELDLVTRPHVAVVLRQQDANSRCFDKNLHATPWPSRMVALLDGDRIMSFADGVLHVAALANPKADEAICATWPDDDSARTTETTARHSAGRHFFRLGGTLLIVEEPGASALPAISPAVAAGISRLVRERAAEDERRKHPAYPPDIAAQIRAGEEAAAAELNAEKAKHPTPTQLKGRLRDPAGAPLAHVKIEVEAQATQVKGIGTWRQSQTFLHALTNADGTFVLDGVEPGLHVVRVHSPHIADRAVLVEVPARGANANLTITAARRRAVWNEGFGAPSKSGTAVSLDWPGVELAEDPRGLRVSQVSNPQLTNPPLAHDDIVTSWNGQKLVGLSRNDSIYFWLSVGEQHLTIERNGKPIEVRLAPRPSECGAQDECATFAHALEYK